MYINFFWPWWRGLAVSSPPATEETGAMGREIKSRKEIGGLVFKENKIKYFDHFNSYPKISAKTVP
jgi:hypothetical protein